MITKAILKQFGISPGSPHLMEYGSMVTSGIIIILIGLYISMWGFIAYGVATGTIYICALAMSISKDREIPAFDLAWTILTSLTTLILCIFYFKINILLSILAMLLFIMTIGASYKQIVKMIRKQN